MSKKIDRVLHEIDDRLKQSVNFPPMDDYDAGILEGLRLAREILAKEKAGSSPKVHS